MIRVLYGLFSGSFRGAYHSDYLQSLDTEDIENTNTAEVHPQAARMGKSKGDT